MNVPWLGLVHLCQRIVAFETHLECLSSRNVDGRVSRRTRRQFTTPPRLVMDSPGIFLIFQRDCASLDLDV